MNVGSARVTGPRLLAASLAMLAGCTPLPPARPGPVVAVDYVPTSGCATEFRTPRIVATSAAVLPDALWEQKSLGDANVRFRIDAGGTPMQVRASVARGGSGRVALEEAVEAAVSRYRFCRPVDFATNEEWRAQMRFLHQALDRGTGAGEMFVQLFVPAYSRDEVREQRTGTVLVRGFFAQDGRPSSVKIVSSSGDPVLDQKTLEAMAVTQLVFRPGTVLTRPLMFEQPYKYEIR
jgi:TonB family protein